MTQTQAAELHEALLAFHDAASRGALPLHLPVAASAPTARGEGHFHLAPELFLQVAGWTDFRFPDGACRLRAGQALLVPPQLRHDETVGDDGRARTQRFRNLVLYAEGEQLRCHLAQERERGRPGIAHLEVRRHTQARPLHDWLCDAARLAAAGARGQSQARALVAAAIAGMLQALEEGDDAGAPAEPPLIARLRVLVQNQLGDSGLSVQRLAQQSGCSADHLAQQFRAVTGEPLLSRINRLRIERSQRLLAETSLAVKEIAWACGYASPGYFIRVFRQHCGVTPQAWREAQAGA
ncbi:helix-turn-helix transcriptional regulator [Variovorax sp. YR752]|uniref:helix-turn-helix transcriptional regulator n=1 Tax=Variovorax sp. YR752 TaxID=1884383 RepID=UPI00313798B1